MMRATLFLFLLLFLAGTAQAQRTVVQRGKEWVCPVPKQQGTQAEPAEELLIELPNVWCAESPLLSDSMAGLVANFKLELFDRWGNLIAGSSDARQAFDKMSISEKYRPRDYDTIIFRMTFTVNGEQRKHIGHVMISHNCNCG